LHQLGPQYLQALTASRSTFKRPSRGLNQPLRAVHLSLRGPDLAVHVLGVVAAVPLTLAHLDGLGDAVLLPDQQVVLGAGPLCIPYGSLMHALSGLRRLLHATDLVTVGLNRTQRLGLA